jgi:hypothetical protein
LPGEQEIEKMRIFILIILLMSFGLSLSAQEYHRQRMLIRSQPFLTSAELSYSGMLQTDADKRYPIERIVADLQPIAIVNQPNMLLSLGFGGYFESYKDPLYSGPMSGVWYPGDKPEYTAYYLSFFGTGGWRNHWYWTTYHTVGSNGLSGQWDKPVLRHFQVTWVGYKFADNMTAFGGLMTIFGPVDQLVLPVAGFNVSSDSWVFTSLLPQYIDFRYLISDKLHFKTGVRYLGSGFRHGEGDTKFLFATFAPYLETERKVFTWTWLLASVSYEFGGSIEYLDTDRDKTIADFDTNPGFSLKAGFIIRVD